MEAKGSLPQAQKPSTCPHSAPYCASPCHYPTS